MRAGDYLTRRNIADSQGYAHYLYMLSHQLYGFSAEDHQKIEKILKK